jgi:hypothetical protein
MVVMLVNEEDFRHVSVGLDGPTAGEDIDALGERHAAMLLTT